MKNTLVIDTSDKVARFGLFQDDKLADSLEWEAHRELSNNFYTKLDELLGRNGISYQGYSDLPAGLVETPGVKDPKTPGVRPAGKEKLDSIIVVRGPGSFTGLRIGIVIVNAFAYAMGIETAGVIQRISTHRVCKKSPTPGVRIQEMPKENEKMSLEEIYNVGKKELKKGQILEPFYGREPNITVKKR